MSHVQTFIKHALPILKPTVSVKSFAIKKHKLHRRKKPGSGLRPKHRKVHRRSHRKKSQKRKTTGPRKQLKFFKKKK